MAKYPECDKLAALKGRRDRILRFLEWLGEQKISLCEWSSGEYYDTRRRDEDLVMDFLGIDRKKLEVERVAMLDEQRKLNEKGGGDDA